MREIKEVTTTRWMDAKGRVTIDKAAREKLGVEDLEEDEGVAVELTVRVEE